MIVESSSVGCLRLLNLYKVAQETPTLEMGQHKIKAFFKLKELMPQASVLACPVFSNPFIAYTDASDVGNGAVLMQEQDSHFDAIRFDFLCSHSEL
jgi:hypothetical protein